MKPYQASGTVLVSRFVKISGTMTVAQAGATDKPCGIAQMGGRTAPIPAVTADPSQAALTGEHLNVFGPGEECLLVIGTGGITAGVYLKPGTNGVGVAVADSGKEYIGAQALETRSEGEYCRVRVMDGAIYT